MKTDFDDRFNWGQLSHGVRYDYDNGRLIGELRVEHLAHSLAGINRYNSWTETYWPLAAHGCLVAEILAANPDVPLGVVFGGLHHDDHETLTGDWLSPLKAAMSDATRAELAVHAWRAQKAILGALGILEMVPHPGDSRYAVIVAADIAALEAERRALFPIRLTWATERIVNPQMLATAERVMSSTWMARPEVTADRFVSRHRAILQRLGGIR